MCAKNSIIFGEYSRVQWGLWKRKSLPMLIILKGSTFDTTFSLIEANPWFNKFDTVKEGEREKDIFFQRI